MPTKDIHHPHSPSRLAQQEICPGSYRMSIGLEDKESDDASEGTMLHLAVEKGKVLDEFSEEQKDAVQQCIEYFDMIAPEKAVFEKEVEISVLDGFDLITEGTMDSRCICDDMVIGTDNKFGRIYVDINKSIQVEAYALGLMQLHGLPTEFHVVQPRCNNFRCRRFELAEMPTIMERIKGIIATCKESKMILNPTEDGCRYCLAALHGTCPAVTGIITDGALAKIEHCSELTTEVISELLPKAKAVKKVIASLENQARERLIQGEEIPGYGLQISKGSQKVKQPQKVYEAISDWVKHEDFMECVTIGVTKLLDTYARARQEKEKEAGNKIALKQLKEELQEAIMPFIERGSDTKKLVSKSQEK